MHRPAQPQAAAADIARRLLKSNLVDVRPLVEGVMNYMFCAEARSGPRIAIRIYPPQRRKIARYEPQLLARLREQGCLVPEVLAAQFPRSEAELAWMAYRYVDGVTLAKRAQAISARSLAQLSAEIVKNLVLMSRVRISGFGGLVTECQADEPSALEFVRRSFTQGIAGAKQHGLLEPALIGLLERVAERCDVVVASLDGSLAWGDLAGGNVILDSADRLAGLVDFESSFVLDRALSVGYFTAASPDEPLAAALVAASKAEGFEFQVNKIRFAAILRAARMAKFAHQRLPRGLEQRPIAQLLPGSIRALEELAAIL